MFGTPIAGANPGVDVLPMSSLFTISWTAHATAAAKQPGTDYNIGSDPALWPPQGPMQGMADGGGAPFPMNPGIPYNQGGPDVSGYPGSQPQRTPMSMRMLLCVCLSVCVYVSLYLCECTYVSITDVRGLLFTGSHLELRFTSVMS